MQPFWLTPWRVVLAWIIVFGLAAICASRLPSHLQGGGWTLAASESGRVDRILSREFGWDPTRTDLVVFSDPARSYLDYRPEALAALDRLGRERGVSRILSVYSLGDRRLVSPDGHTTYALVSYSLAEGAVERAIPTYRRAILTVAPLKSHLTGNMAYNYDLEQASQQDLQRVERFTFPLVGIMLVIVFGSLWAGLLPLALGAVSMTLAMAGLELISGTEPISIYAPNAASMLGLGLGIDFSLLFVTRYRSELSGGKTIPEAIARTLGTAGRAIFFSGLTLTVSMLTVTVLSNVMVLRSQSLAVAFAAAFAVISALTLLPALLVLMGRRIGRDRRGLQGTAIWERWGRFVMRRPWRWTILVVALLGLLAYPVHGIRTAFPGFEAIPPSYESSQGFSLLSSAFGPGESTPIYLTMRTGPEGLYRQEFRRALARWVASWQADPRIKRIDAWSNALPVSRYLSLSPASLLFDPLSRLRSAPWANLEGSADVTVVQIVPKVGVDPFGLISQLRSSRSRSLPFVQELLVGGIPASHEDMTGALDRSYPVITGCVLAWTFAILLVFLRSLWLPAKAMVMTGLSVLACYGGLVLVFQHGVGAALIGLDPPGHLTGIVPLLLFAVLFGLGTDYEVFLLTRVRELRREGHDDSSAIALGLGDTGRVITAAAATMVAVFATFACSRVTVIKEIGVGLSLGVFIDATLIRMVLVPATMHLLGKWNWWLPAKHRILGLRRPARMR